MPSVALCKTLSKAVTLTGAEALLSTSVLNSELHAARLERLSFLREAMPSKKIIAEGGMAALIIIINWREKPILNF